MRTALRMLGLCFGVATLSGCAVALLGGGLAAGAGTVGYVRGELRTVESVSMDQAWSAAQSTMKSLEYTTVKQEKDALNANLLARGAGDKKIAVRLKNKGTRLTEIRIRVGLWGDEALSRRILESMQKQFPKAS